MMRGVGTWAVAVRKPADPQAGPVGAGARRDSGDHRADHPVVTAAPGSPAAGGPGRGGAGGVAGHRTARAEHLGQRRRCRTPSQEISGGAWFGTVLVSLVFAIGLFFVVPVGVTSLIKDQLGSSVLFWLVEGVLRTAIFLGYLTLLSRVRDLRRVFEYHGAEHKVISCYEAGDELTPARGPGYSRLHPRCGTSFLLIVMIMAIFVFAPVGLPAWWILVLTRIVGVPLIAGLSFEVIKWAGRNRRRRWVQLIMYPGLQLQRLTTREPDLDELAVSITALQAVLAVETPGAASAEDLLGVEVVA